jgi:adenosylhomocysteine nucleosidase
MKIATPAETALPAQAHIPNAPLGIIAALHDELRELLALTLNKRRHAIGNREFWSGDLHGRQVVLVQCRVGKVAAAATTAALITCFHVREIVLTGVAGGLAPHVAVGDVVISTELLQHDIDASPLFPRWEVPLTGQSRFPATPELARSLAGSTRATLADLPSLLGRRTMTAFAIDAPKVHTGLIVSGDRFVATTRECETLKRDLPDALAVEMEGAAVAQVCHEWGVPFVAIRAISDRADDHADIDFPRFLADVAAKYSAGILRLWLSGKSHTRAGADAATCTSPRQAPQPQ